MAMARKQTKTDRDLSVRAERLGFRLDEQTKELIERAAHLERRKLTDFCVAALTDAARRRSQNTRHLCCPNGTGRPSSTR